MSEAISEFQLGYIGWLTTHVGCPVPYPELLSETEAAWLIRALKERLWAKRKLLSNENINQTRGGQPWNKQKLWNGMRRRGRTGSGRNTEARTPR